jgi:hypothetical protein
MQCIRISLVGGRGAKLNLGRSKETIVFEGGLGSQLLPLLHALKLHNDKIEFDVNCDYFYPDAKTSNMVQRPWRLDRYGLSIDRIAELGSKKEPRIFKRLNSRGMTDWDFGRAFGRDLLTLNYTGVQSLLTEHSVNPDKPYSVIHLRRGDYLKVSSRVVSDDEVSDIAFKLRYILHDTVIVISDSKINLKRNPKFKKLIMTSKSRFVFIEGLDYDECLLHDVMRNSSLLICSNSTFSFSAAILGGSELIAFAPIDFFDPESMALVNQRFRSAGNFFLLE